MKILDLVHMQQHKLIPSCLYNEIYEKMGESILPLVHMSERAVSKYSNLSQTNSLKNRSNFNLEACYFF